MSLGPTIISIGIFNGLMLTLIFVRKSGHNFYLGLFFLVQSFILFKYLSNVAIGLEQFNLVFEIGDSLEWLSAPLLYFYVSKFNGKKISNAYLHFIPFTISILFYFLSSNSQPLTTLSPLKIIQGFIYILLILKNLKNNSWLKMVTLLFTIEMFAIALYSIQSYFFEIGYLTDFFIPIVIILNLNIIAFSGMMRSTIFLPTAKSAKNESLDLKAVQDTFLKVKQLIENDQLYLSPNIKLSDLASKLSVSEKNISQAINECTGENINAFINKYRIRAAEELLINEKFRHFTIDAIAEESGFSNKVSFYKAFKKIHNMSPKEFADTQTT